MFYSATERGFFSKEINGDNIPVDAVEITKEEWQALLKGQADGKRIVPDERGRPILADPAPIDESAQKRAEAQAYLNGTDWMVVRSVETGKKLDDEVRQRRAEARNILSA